MKRARRGSGSTTRVREAPTRRRSERPSVDDGRLLAEILEQQPAQAGVADGAPPVGECTDEHHPTLTGRVRVRWTDDRGQHEAWLAHLHGVTVRVGDRVLLQQPWGWDEPLVAGVIDGLARRRKAEKHPGASVSLRPDESLRVQTEDGKPLAEVVQEASGPVVRLLGADVDVELPGALRIKAGAIRLEAERGSVEIKASDDVVVQGEEIELN